MAAVEWLFPETLDEALKELSKPGAQPVAGGTTVLDLLKMGHKCADRLIDLSRLGLKEILSKDEITTVGALSSNTDVVNSVLIQKLHPALSEAIASGASQQIRNMATVGGNLMQATRCAYFRSTDWPCNRSKPGSGCAAIEVPGAGHAILGGSSFCIATHPSDMAVALLAFDANVRVAVPHGYQTIPIAQFFRLPENRPQDVTALPKEGLIVAVEMPQHHYFRNSGYLKLRGRASYEFACVSVAAALEVEGNVVRNFALAFGGIATVPWRDRDAEKLLIDRPLTPEAINKFCDVLLAEAHTRPETRYKIALARGAVHHLLNRLAKP